MRRRKPSRNGETGNSVASFHGQESGQVTLLFVFCSIAVVVLLGFLLNTAQVTSRKMEMQGAADSAAVGGAVWMARGMNLMVLDNNGMTDVLGVMISVHALNQTCQAMVPILTGMIADLLPAEPWTTPIVVQLGREIAFYEAFHAGILGQIDRSLSDPNSGMGWKVMNALDTLNQAIKAGMPFVAEAEAISYGRANGADRAPFALIVSGGAALLPFYPVGRGGNQFLATEANQNVLPGLRAPAILALEAACVLSEGLCLTPITIAVPVYLVAVSSNVSNLANGQPTITKGAVSASEMSDSQGPNGQTVQQMLNSFNAAQQLKNPNAAASSLSSIVQFFSISGPLSWPDNPPYPMLLTDQQVDANGMIPNIAAPLNYNTVRQRLQFLAVAFGQMKPAFLAPIRFTNPAPLGWITYGQADVYDPNNWWMFDQDWRAKLSRTTLLEQKAAQIGQFANLPNNFNQGLDFSFVNTH